MGIDFAPTSIAPSFDSDAQAFIRNVSTVTRAIRADDAPKARLRAIEFACATLRRQIATGNRPDTAQLVLLAEGTRLVELSRRQETIDHDVTDLDRALQFAAGELCSMGFERSMVFRNEGTTLQAVATEFVAAPDWAADNHNHAIANPVPVRTELFEAAVMLQQVPAIVSSPIEDARAWQPIVTRLRCDGYVVAPLVVNGNTVGTIHADCHFSQTTLDEGHRDQIASLAASLSRRLSDTDQQPRRLAAPINLTQREDDVLSQLRRGLTNNQIARELHVSQETVKSHVAKILRKLDVPNRTAAATHPSQR